MVSDILMEFSNEILIELTAELHLIAEKECSKDVKERMAKMFRLLKGMAFFSLKSFLHRSFSFKFEISVPKLMHVQDKGSRILTWKDSENCFMTLYTSDRMSFKA